MSLSPQQHDARPGRYGCLECRDDAEAVMSGRIHPSVQARYEAHVAACAACRRAHRLLEAVYRGPAGAPTPSAPAREREFKAILRKLPEARAVPSRIPLAAAVATATAALALLIFDVALAPEGDVQVPSVASLRAATSALLSEDSSAADDEAVTTFTRRARVDYGRIIGGQAQLTSASGGALTTDTFEVGTSIRVGPGEHVQARLAGSILANLGPNAELTWKTVAPDLIELELHRGMLATRYDRNVGEPVLKVKTPSAVVRVVGTVFTVEVAQPESTVVSVLRGEVQVLEPARERLVAEVEAGYRFDAALSTFADVGRAEVQAALPLSDAALAARAPELDELDATHLADGRIPESWVIPGLPQDPNLRTLDRLIVSRRPARRGTSSRDEAWSDKQLFDTLIAPLAPARDDEGKALIEALKRDLERTRRKELRAKLQRCQQLYQSAQTRYLAARCITEFMNRHGNERGVAEGWLLYGILRMDYASDYTVATSAFRKFLARAPGHPEAELALYRLWLASTETGEFVEAERRGREYLRRYPNGRFVGKILKRYPDLIVEL